MAMGMDLSVKTATAAATNTSYTWPHCKQTTRPIGVDDERFHDCGEMPCHQWFCWKPSVYQYLAWSYDLHLARVAKHQYRDLPDGTREERTCSVAGDCEGYRADRFVVIHTPFNTWEEIRRNEATYDPPYQEIAACLCDPESDGCLGGDDGAPCNDPDEPDDSGNSPF